MRPSRSQALRPIITAFSIAVRSTTCACSACSTRWRLAKSRRKAYRLASMPSRPTMATTKKVRGTMGVCDTVLRTCRAMSVPGSSRNAW
ncbi:hypothetical protein D9M69_707870 [compost metagenome]